MATDIRIAVLADAQRARRELASVTDGANKVQGRMGKLSSFAKGAAGGMVAFFAADKIVSGVKSVVKSASDAQQSIGATETVFGKYAKTVVRTSDQAATRFGLSANSYRENANLLGALFKNQGVSTDKLAAKTKQFIGIGSDLAATFGGTTKDAVEALSSALKGEFDPLERYGVSLKQSTVNLEAYRVAGVNSASAFGQLSQAEQKRAKQAAITNLITKQSADSHGAFARETGTLAHQQQVLAAKFDNVKAKIGAALLPILTKLFAWISDKVMPAVDSFGKALSNGTGPIGAYGAWLKRVADVAQVVGHWIGSELVPFIRDLAKRFGDAMGGTRGFSRSLNDAKPAAVVLGKVLGVLWSALKLAARIIIPLVVAQFKRTMRVLGLVGSAAIQMWNRGFQPALRFVVKGIASVIRFFARLVGAIAKIPGPQQKAMKAVARSLAGAGRDVDRFAGKIRKIPPSKRTKIDHNAGAATAALAGVTRTINNIPNNKTVRIAINAAVSAAVAGAAGKTKGIVSTQGLTTTRIGPSSLSGFAPVQNIAVTVEVPVGASQAQIGRTLTDALRAYAEQGGRAPW